MGLPTFSIRRPVLVAMIFLCMAILGIISLYGLKVELYQGSAQGIISIIVRARGGLPPSEVEKMITKPVEESVSTVSRLKTMYSNSREAESRVTLEFEPGTNMDFAALEIREKFARIKPLLPKEIEKPVIANYDDSQSAIMVFAVTSESMTPEEIRDVVDNEMKPSLTRVDGVASVEVYGGRERKILVELDRDKMIIYNISIERVMDILGQSNINLLAGSIESGKLELAIRTMGSFLTIEEIGELGIKASRQGTIIPLKEIATIKDAYMEPTNHARLNLEQNVTVYVKKESLSNTLSVAKSIGEVIEEFKKEQQGTFEVVVVNNMAETIAKAIGDVKQSLFIGLILTVFVICIFMGRKLPVWLTLISIPITVGIFFFFKAHLGDMNIIGSGLIIALSFLLLGLIVDRAVVAFIMLVSIPFSLVITFIFMAVFDISINVMTLSGLALSMGILVDSAVVVVENIMAKKEKGYSDLRAIKTGSEQVWLPLLASMITTLVVFLPIIFIDKKIQITYGGLAFTVTFSLLASFFVALMLVPMLLNQFAHGYLGSGFSTGPLMRWMLSFYGKTMKRIFDWSFLARLLIVVLVFAVAIFSTWRISKKAIDWPTSYQENEFAIVSFPLAGARLEANDEAIQKLEDLLRKIPDIEMYSSTIGKNDLRVFVRLKPKSKREYSKEEIIKIIDEKGSELVKEVHDDYGLIVDEGASSGEQKKLVVEIFGHEGDVLERLAKEFATKMSNINGISNIVMTDLRKRPEYSLVVDKGRAAYYGIRVKDVADSIHAQLRGMRPTKFRELEKGKEIETITRLQPIYRQKLDDLRLIHVATRESSQIPIQEIANFYPSVGPQSVDRKNKYRYVFVKGDVRRPIEDVAKDVEAAVSSIELPDEYYWRYGGNYDELVDSKSQLAIALILTLFLVYMVMASLFQSYTLPLLVMVTVPMALIGVWVALDWPTLISKLFLLFGYDMKQFSWFPESKPLSQQVFIGAILLAGYVVNAAIIMVDHMQHLREKGDTLKAALLRSGLDRLRPIMMTTCSTVLGFMPLALALGQSSDLWSPLAITVIGGLLTSTFLTLFVIPNLILVTEQIKEWVSGNDLHIDHSARGVKILMPKDMA